MNAKDLLLSRKSVRTFTGKLSEDELNAVIAAAQGSPVGLGKHELLHLTVIKNKALLDEIDKNAVTVLGDPKMVPLYGAPCYIVISVAVDVPHLAGIYESSAAIMAEHMSLSAVANGLGSCLIWGASMALNANPALTAKLNLPEGFKPYCGIVIGETEETYANRDIPADRVKVSYIK